MKHSLIAYCQRHFESPHFLRLYFSKVAGFKRGDNFIFVPILEKTKRLPKQKEEKIPLLSKFASSKCFLTDSLWTAFLNSYSSSALTKPELSMTFFSNKDSLFEFPILMVKNAPLLEEESLKENDSLLFPSFSYLGKDLSFYLKKVRPYLSEHRFLHSVSVASLCYKIALNNHLPNLERYYIAGLLHDIGKRFDEISSRKIMKGNFDEYLNYPTWAFHQFVGCLLAKRDFGVKEKEILDAICFHCTGKANMGPLGEIVYSADKIDPLRGWESKRFVDLCFIDYHDGFLETLEANRLFLAKKMRENETLCELSKECYRYYLGE